MFSLMYKQLKLFKSVPAKGQQCRKIYFINYSNLILKETSGQRENLLWRSAAWLLLPSACCVVFCVKSCDSEFSTHKFRVFHDFVSISLNCNSRLSDRWLKKDLIFNISAKTRFWSWYTVQSRNMNRTYIVL